MSKRFVPYTPANWYWYVGSDETRVYSSARKTFVPADDAEFMAWNGPDFEATKIVNSGELIDVLADAGCSDCAAGLKP